jgi:hypothetical protein
LSRDLIAVSDWPMGFNDFNIHELPWFSTPLPRKKRDRRSNDATIFGFKRPIVVVSNSKDPKAEVFNGITLIDS